MVIKMRLISEITEEYQTSQELDEATGTKTTYIEGIFAQADLKNRNGRVYPKFVLERAVNDYNEKYVKTNRALGELNHPSCYFYNDFKVLTPSGWKHFNDITIGEDVYCMNDNRNLVVGKVLRKIAQPVVNEYAYHIKSRDIDSTVTGNHRFYCLDRNDNIVILTAKELYERNTNKIRIIKNFVPVYSNSQETVTIHGCSLEGMPETYWRKFITDPRPDLIFDAKDFCAFLGFYLAEGCVSKKKHDIFLYQNSGPVIEEFKQLLNRMNIPYIVRIKHRKNDHETIRIVDKRIHDYLAKLGICYDKYIPEEILQLGPECLIELLNWFAKGDGRKVINGSKKRKELALNIFSTSKRLIEDFNMVLLKCGFAGKIHVIEPTKDKEYMFADHIIRDADKHILYLLSISAVSGIWLDKRFIKIDRSIVNSGFVYCLETTYGNFYIEDKRKQYLTGNSPSVDPERACIKINSLTWNGSNVLGKAQVLTTPKGQILEALIHDGVKLGVSTRGLGSVKKAKFGNESVSMVGDDYQIRAIDVVHNPSGIDCFVDGILENVEFYYENGVLCEKEIEQFTEDVRKNDVNAIFRDFEKTINKIVYF